MDPFTFRWTPGRLLGLGVRLGAEQAAVATEHEAYVVAVLTQEHPLCLGCGDRHAIAADDEWNAVEPYFLRTTLNQILEPDAVPLQDIIDRENGVEWREYTTAVSHESFSPRIWRGGDHRRAWDALVVDQPTWERWRDQAEDQFNDSMYSTALMLMDAHEQLSDYQFADDDSEHLAELEDTVLAHSIEMGLDPEQRPEEQMDPSDFLITYRFDPDLQKIWDGLIQTSRHGWDALGSTAPKRSMFFHEQGEMCPWS